MISSGDDAQHKYYKLPNHTYTETHAHIYHYIHIYIYIYTAAAYTDIEGHVS